MSELVNLLLSLINRSLQGVGDPSEGSPLGSLQGVRTPLSSTVDVTQSLLARAGVLEEEDLQPERSSWLQEQGLIEDWDCDYGLLPPEDTVIIRPYGGDDDDIMLQEVRPRFVVMYEPNLPFVRRLEVSAVILKTIADCCQVYKNCNPGLPLRVYQMTYTNSSEEERFLATMSREAEAFKKLIADRGVSGSADAWLTSDNGHPYLQSQPARSNA